MKFLKKTIGLLLALAMGACSMVALSACDTSNDSTDANLPLTEEQKVALKNDLYTAMDEGQTKEYKGMDFSATLSMSQASTLSMSQAAETFGIALSGSAFVTSETSYGADLYVSMNTAEINGVGGAFLRDGMVYYTETTAADKAALVLGVTGGNTQLIGATLSDLMEKLGMMGGIGMPDIPAEDDSLEGGEVTELASMSKILMGLMQSVTPILEQNGMALLDKYIGKVGAADKAEGGYELKITLAEVVDAIMDTLSKAAIVLDSARDVKISALWDVPAVKELTDVLFKDVTAAQLDEMIRPALLSMGVELPEIETEGITAAAYLKTICGMFVAEDTTVGALIDMLTSSILGEAVPMSGLVTYLNTYVSMFKQMITAEVSLKFDANKQIVAYAMSFALDTTSVSPTKATKVSVSVELKLLDAAPELIDLTNANIVIDEGNGNEENSNDAVELPVVPLAA